MTGKPDSARGRPYKTDTLLHSLTVERKRGLRRSGDGAREWMALYWGAERGQLTLWNTEGPLVEGFRLGPVPGADLGGHTPHLTASIVGAAPGRGSDHRDTAHPLRAPAQAHTYFTRAGDRRAVDAQATHAAGGRRGTQTN